MAAGFGALDDERVGARAPPPRRASAAEVTVHQTSLPTPRRATTSCEGQPKVNERRRRRSLSGTSSFPSQSSSSKRGSRARPRVAPRPARARRRSPRSLRVDGLLRRQKRFAPSSPSVSARGAPHAVAEPVGGQVARREEAYAAGVVTAAASPASTARLRAERGRPRTQAGARHGLAAEPAEHGAEQRVARRRLREPAHGEEGRDARARRAPGEAGRRRSEREEREVLGQREPSGARATRRRGSLGQPGRRPHRSRCAPPARPAATRRAGDELPEHRDVGVVVPEKPLGRPARAPPRRAACGPASCGSEPAHAACVRSAATAAPASCRSSPRPPTRPRWCPGPRRRVELRHRARRCLAVRAEAERVRIERDARARRRPGRRVCAEVGDLPAVRAEQDREHQQPDLVPLAGRASEHRRPRTSARGSASRRCTRRGRRRSPGAPARWSARPLAQRSPISIRAGARTSENACSSDSSASACSTRTPSALDVAAHVAATISARSSSVVSRRRARRGRAAPPPRRCGSPHPGAPAATRTRATSTSL